MCVDDFLAGWGLIPAYAGSTWAWHNDAAKYRAHPRLRGEHGRNTGSPRHAGGSSPLTRGARCRGVRAGVVVWLIPAYAGSTGAAWCLSLLSEAHPRFRGEHLNIRLAAKRDRGSSPLTRGARYPVPGLPDREGLIPAYAGSTAMPWFPVVSGGAHPRLRGEHIPKPDMAFDTSGSSPLTRGAQPQVLP